MAARLCGLISLSGCLAGRDSSGFQQPLLCCPGIRVASQSFHWVHSCHTSIQDQSVGRGQSSSGGQAICLTWLLKSMIICREQVWFVHEWAEIEEALHLKWSICVCVCPRCMFQMSVQLSVFDSLCVTHFSVHTSAFTFVCAWTFFHICRCMCVGRKRTKTSKQDYARCMRHVCSAFDRCRQRKR